MGVLLLLPENFLFKGKLKMKKEINVVELDEEAINEKTIAPVQEEVKEEKFTTKKRHISAAEAYSADGRKLVNCLQNRRVSINLVPKRTGLVQNSKHILGGGMADSAVRYFTVPVLRSGVYTDVLTPSEKTYLEYIMGLEVDALSIYKRENNFWANKMVRLTKFDNYLDLSTPDDFIKYKILLANKDYIAPSLEELNSCHKASYQFVIVDDGADVEQKTSKINATEKCYERYGELKNDTDTLRVIVETIDGRPTTSNQKLEFLQSKCYDFIQNNPKLFLEVSTDEFLPTKVLLKKAVEMGVVYVRGNFYYLREDNLPLCGVNEDPTFSTAARFLNLPKNQALRFSIEAKSKTN